MAVILAPNVQPSIVRDAYEVVSGCDGLKLEFGLYEDCLGGTSLLAAIQLSIF